MSESKTNKKKNLFSSLTRFEQQAVLSSSIFKIGALEKETNPDVMRRYCTLSESFVDYETLRDHRYYYMNKTLVELVGVGGAAE